jgi:hypothetical protein
VDYDGSVEARTRHYLVRHPDAPFEEVEREVLAPYEGNVVVSAVSPRVFEAAALGTAMVMFPGAYSGVVEPWTHYVPLEKDFSNMGEIAKRLRDDRFLAELTERAHADLVASGRFSLRRFVESFDELVAARSTARSPAAKPAYARAAGRRRSVVRRAVARVRPVVGKAAQPVVMAGLAARDPAVRTLAVSSRASANGGRSALAADLWRLAALRRAVRAGLVHTVASVEEGGRRVVLASLPGPAPTERRPLTEEVRAAIESGALTELIWDHSAVGDVIPLLAEGLLVTRVGERGTSGAHDFCALVELGRRHPQGVLEALGPLLAGETGTQPA